MIHPLLRRPSALLCAALASTSLTAAQAQDYRALTDTWHSFTNFNVEVVRGMALDGTTMYAVHPTQCTLVKFTPFYTEVARWRTLNGPVSVAVHEGSVYVVCQSSNALVRHDPSNGRILDVLPLLAEPADLVIDAENDRAYVSCMGSDAVVCVDLVTPLRVHDVWSWAEGLRLKRPRFMHLDLGAPGPGDNRVWVAPLISGNNTLITDDVGVVQNSPHGDKRNKILDANKPADGLTGGGLPDEDIFLIDPNAAGQQVFPMVKGAGSLILAHGRNPHNGDYWILNVDHHNAVTDDPGTIGESAARGRFAANRLSIVRASSLPQVPAPGGNPIEPAVPDVITDLDDLTPSGAPSYESERSVPFPYSLHFLPGGGAVVAGSMNGRFIALDASGVRNPAVATESTTTNVAAGITGSVVRQMLSAGQYFLAYCQGSSNILVYNWVIEPGKPFLSIPLGEDPTPAPIRRGRDIWYDASRSAGGRTSCNTCHPQGLSDGLVWEISGLPADNKGPMATQPLCGIEDTFPYHWRGERRLQDFNVFEELLGGTHVMNQEHNPEGNLDDSELADFMAFIFSLTCPPNPAQYGPPTLDGQGRFVLDLRRKIDPALTDDYNQGEYPGTVVADPSASTAAGELSAPTIGNPIVGDAIFHAQNSDNSVVGANLGSCVNCHSGPTGSSGDWSPDASDRIPSKSNLEVAHLDNQLTLKRQPLVNVTFTGGEVVTTNLLGSGTSHSGHLRGHFDFVADTFGPDSPQDPPLSDQDVADVAAFLDIFDNGLAPAAQWAVRLHSGSAPGTQTSIRNNLVGQAKKGWLGVAVHGRFPVNGVLVDVRWYYDTVANRFVPDLAPSVLGPKELKDFDKFHGGLYPDNVFFGVPPGNERWLSVDADNDGAFLYADTDPWHFDELIDPAQPTFVKVRFEFASASLVKVVFQASEPVTWKLDLSPTQTGVSDILLPAEYPDTFHTAIVHGLDPSTLFGGIAQDNQYLLALEIKDKSGNTAVYEGIPEGIPEVFHSGSIAKLDGTDEFELTDLAELEHLPEVLSGPGFFYQNLVKVRVAWREGAPPASQSVSPAPDQVVVGQLLERDANQLDWSVVPTSTTSSNATARDFVLWPEPYFWSSGSPATSCSDLPGYQQGNLLVLPPTNVDGRTEVRFNVEGGDDKEFLFNIVAIIPAQWGLSPCLPPISAQYNPLTPTFDVPDLAARLRNWVTPVTMLREKRSVSFVQ